MRLRLSRRPAGPAVAHGSRYGPQSAPKITSAQRDAIYGQILDQIGRAGDLLPLVEQGDLGVARRLAREVTDDLQLVLDALGWGETSGVAKVKLDLPAEQLRRTFARLHERAIEQREEHTEGSSDTQTPYERALVVIEACDQVLAVVGADPRAAAE